MALGMEIGHNCCSVPAIASTYRWICLDPRMLKGIVFIKSSSFLLNIMQQLQFSFRMVDNFYYYILYAIPSWVYAVSIGSRCVTCLCRVLYSWPCNKTEV